MAATDLTSYMSITITEDCAAGTQTLTDGTDYDSAGVSRDDLLVDFTVKQKRLSGDSSVSLTYNDASVTSLSYDIPKSGWYQVTMSISQETDAVKSTLTGTVSVTNGDATVTGSGTAFNTELTAGDLVEISDVTYTVATVNSATKITLSDTYAGTTASGLTAYLVPEYSGSITEDYFTLCDIDECMIDNFVTGAKETQCGCEGKNSKVKKGLEVFGLKQTIEYMVQERHDFTAAQRMVEYLEEVCDDCC